MVLISFVVQCTRPIRLQNCVFGLCPTFKRLSTARPVPSKTYPSSLLIYHAGTLQTATIGMIRISTIMFFAAGCLIGAPAIYFDPASPNWRVPLIIAGSAVPMAVTVALTAPFVASVSVLLPSSARGSRAALMKFADKPARDTVLELTTMRFMPFPKRTAVRLDELRRIPEKGLRMANLVHIVPRQNDRTTQKSSAAKAEYYVRPGDRYTAATRAPGIWPVLLKNIPSAAS